LLQIRHRLYNMCLYIVIRCHVTPHVLFIAVRPQQCVGWGVKLYSLTHSCSEE